MRPFIAALVWLLLLSSAFGFDVRVTIKKIDLEAGTLTVTANGREHTAKLVEGAKIYDEAGKELSGGLKAKGIAVGAEVTLTVEREGDRPVIKAIRFGKVEARPGGRPGGKDPSKTTVGFTPLCDMTAEDAYKGEDGGLYGGGSNEPPAEHRKAAETELARIVPLNAVGEPAADGNIGLISISMSNATQEFSLFKRIADADADKSPRVVIVDCAQGGQAMAEWASPDAEPWKVASRILANSRVSDQQVQVAWIKLANKGPRGDLEQHGGKLKQDTLAVLHNAKARFPNLRVAYLGSRIYGGYSTGGLNPEPYAYESSFPARWLIQEQIAGESELNYDPERGEVRAPLLLWGPYLWADGTQPRKSDGLIWEADDLTGDGVHPSESGRRKVAELLLKFYKSDPLAKGWFASSPDR